MRGLSTSQFARPLSDAEKKERKQRRRTMILVAVPDWPPQDPGRPMLWEARSTPMKAAREIKRLQERMPEYTWSKELLTYTEGRAIKLKPFDARALYRRNRGKADAS